MMRFILIAALLFASESFAQQIPDYSLTPSEMRQQQYNNSTAPINSDQIHSADPSFPSAPLPGGNTLTPAKRFMDGYCDRNFHPAIASDPRYANLGNCLEQQKQQVCNQFQQLPEDVKSALDETIACTESGGDILPPGQEYDQHNAACDNTDTARLQLLKKYWRDPNTAYALVFLPDDVLDSSGKCLRGGR